LLPAALHRQAEHQRRDACEDEATLPPAEREFRRLPLVAKFFAYDAEELRWPKPGEVSDL
jgi:hypothetical protein